MAVAQRGDERDRRRLHHVLGPALGTFATIALVIAAQLFRGVLIDAIGMFGLERIPLNWARVTGLVLLAGVSALVLKR